MKCSTPCNTQNIARVTPGTKMLPREPQHQKNSPKKHMNKNKWEVKTHHKRCSTQVHLSKHQYSWSQALLGSPVHFENALVLHLKPLMLQPWESPPSKGCSCSSGGCWCPQPWGRAQPTSVWEGALTPHYAAQGNSPYHQLAQKQVFTK